MDPSQPLQPKPLPTLTRAQVRELDSLTIHRFGIPGVVLMENAGRALAQELIRERPDPGPVLILCGGGNNGGDGYVVARYLQDSGVPVTVIETSPESQSPDAAVFRQVCVAIGVPMIPIDPGRPLAEFLREHGPFSVVVDALLGTGFQGELREPAATWLADLNHAADQWGSFRVAIDAPSGLDVDTGTFGESCFRADRTLTLAANKPAYQRPPTDPSSAIAVTGRVQVLPIGIPTAVYDAVLGASSAG